MSITHGRSTPVAVTALLAFGLGCSSGSGGGGGAALDCAWLASDNCWKTTAAQATSCLPPSGESGVFDSTHKTCTYASGAVITFDSALTLPVSSAGSSDTVWKFTVTNGGQPCLRYVSDTNGNITLVVAGQTFTEGSDGPLGIRVTCPDGTAYANANALDLLSCDSGFFGGLPGDAWSSSDTSVSFSLINTMLASADASASSSEGVPIFTCNTP
jgi:hypothetical protein